MAPPSAPDRLWAVSLDPKPPGPVGAVTVGPPQLHPRKLLPSTAARYAKERVTSADALASVPHALWAEAALRTSRRRRDLVEVPRPLLKCLTTLACYAA